MSTWGQVCPRQDPELATADIRNLKLTLSQTWPSFLLPGGCPSAAQLHLARTVCRRPERLVLALSRKEGVGPLILQYPNRLSGAFLVMARHENKRRGVPDVLWDSRA